MNECTHMIGGMFFSSKDYHPLCVTTLKGQIDRVDHYLRRMGELGYGPEDAVINFVNVDDPFGRGVIEILMPGQGAVWQKIRDEGKIPFGRGLAERPGYQEFLDYVRPEAGEKLRAVCGKAVIVIDHGTIEVFDLIGVYPKCLN